jgi:hypothetical protein
MDTLNVFLATFRWSASGGHNRVNQTLGMVSKELDEDSRKLSGVGVCVSSPRCCFFNMIK